MDIATNEHTGDKLVSKQNTKAFEENYDLIFRKDSCKKELCCGNCSENKDNYVEESNDTLVPCSSERS